MQIGIRKNYTIYNTNKNMIHLGINLTEDGKCLYPKLQSLNEKNYRKSK